MKKRIWASVLTLTMLLGLLPTAALAEEFQQDPTDDVPVVYSTGSEGDVAPQAEPTPEAAAKLPDAVDGVITLNSDVTIQAFPNFDKLTIDLNGHTLNYMGIHSVVLTNGQELTIKNGTLVANIVGKESAKNAYGTNALFNIQTQCVVEVDHAVIKTNGSALYPQGDAARVTVNASKIYCGTYAVATNAGKRDNYNVIITLNDSEFTTDSGWKDNDGDSCPVMINIPGTLNMDGCTVNGTRQGVVVRGGTATIKNSQINLKSTQNIADGITGSPLNSEKDHALNGDWGGGNNLPMAALVVGNRHESSYQYPTDCTLENTTVTAKNGYTTVYVYGMTSKAGVDRSVTMFYDDASELGEIVNPEGSVAVVGTPVAEINGTKYVSLAEAVTAAKENDTIVLLKDTTESVTIPANAKITLDLNGKTLTNEKDKDTIYVTLGGRLTIEGKGIVDNVSHQKAAVFNNGTVTLNGGSYTRSKETGKSPAEGGENTYYNILNHGMMTINKDVTVSQLGHYSSMIANGYYEYSDSSNERVGYVSSKNAEYPTLTIEGGQFSGGLNTIKNDDNAKLIINGGTFENMTQNVVQNHNEATITNGMFDGSKLVPKDGYTIATILNCGCAANNDIGKLTISGGKFTGGAKGTYVIADVSNTTKATDAATTISAGEFVTNNAALVFKSASAKIAISGGYFTTDPTAYCAEGKVGILTDRKDYPFTVGEAAATDVKPATGDPVVDVEAIPDAHRDAAKTVAESVTDKTGVLPAAANGVVKNVDTTKQNEAKQKFEKEIGAPSPSDPPISIYAQTYLDVKPQTYKEGTADPDSTTPPVIEISMDITPMYRVVASTAERAEDIKVKGETTGSGPANAIVYGDPQKLEIKIPMTISIKLPSLFKVKNGKVYVQHKGYEYTAEVTNGASTGSRIATFTNPHGFSLFTVTSVPAAVAKIGDTSYTTLQAAVDAVSDKGAIVLQKDNSETITVSRAVTFTLDLNGKKFDGKIEAGSGYTLSEKDGVYTITKQSSSSGGSSSGSGSSGNAVSVPSKVSNGTVTVSPKNASKGTTVTVTVKPDSGYQLKDLTVTDKNGNKLALTDKGNGKYTFTMPKSKVDVSASFEEIPTPVAPKTTYVDVPDGMWYTEAVAYVTDKGIMSGIGDQKFGPDVKLTRAMLMTMLARLDGVDTTGGSTWYEKGRAWAMEKGVSDGTDPEGTITREQLVSMLYRYAQYKGYDVSVGEDTNILSYADAQSISEWAMSAMQWACGAGVIHGTSDVTLSPLSSATRAEVAAMFLNYMEHVAK